LSLVFILQFICITGELVVLAQALRYKIWRATPLFVCYLAWNLFSDTVMSPLSHWSAAEFLRLYQVETRIDLVAQTMVLIEITWKLLRPVFTDRRRGVIAVLAATATLLVLLIWPMTAILTDLPYPYDAVVRLGQTEQILGVTWIIVLGITSVILSLPWRDRLVQIATGLFSYSLAGVLVILYRRLTGIDSHGNWLQPLTILAYIGVLIYWMRSFAVQEKLVARTV